VDRADQLCTLCGAHTGIPLNDGRLHRHQTFAPPTAEEVADWLAKAKAAATNSDVVIAVPDELASMSGEAASRATLNLHSIQEQMLEAVAATGKPVVLVLENGRPLDIRWAAQRVPAILEAWYPGTVGGNAVPMCCSAM